jgi:hypothetical protein
VAAIRPRGHGFDQAIDDDVLAKVVAFFPYLPTPMRLSFPMGLRLLELGPAAVLKRTGAVLVVACGPGPCVPRASARDGRPASPRCVLGLRTLVLMNFLSAPAGAGGARSRLGRTGRGVDATSSRAARKAPLREPAAEYRIDYPNVTDGSTLSGHRTFDCDVVVVGTGAGGATAAARLRDAGRDVLMLEEGALHRTETSSHRSDDDDPRLYRDAGTTMILGRPPIIFAEGRCVGGSTVINGGMSWRAPARVLEHWQRDLRLPDSGPRAMARYFAEAERILHAEPNRARHVRREHPRSS